MADATLVTGASGARAPRRGDVLGERYEIVEALESDALVCSYRGNDQESDATILVRCTAPGLLGERDARKLVERGRALVGGGGRVLSSLRDVDREGAMAFTIEAWPRGTSMRAVLDARRAKGATFEPREILPLIARLAAAISSIPDPWWHGDVRAERVWVDPDGLVLTGPFLVSLLPGDAIADALREDVALRRAFAPEVGEGMGGRASDRWGAAAIVWEALTGRAVEPGPVTLSDALGQAALEVARLLSPDPASRSATLDVLVAKIAELAKMPVPRVEPDPFPLRNVEPPDEPTHVAADLAPPTERPPSLADPPTVRSLDTIETDLEEIGTDPSARALAIGSTPPPPDDTAPHKALGADGERRDDLDPRLVRAALADDHELDSRELELVDEATGKKRVPSAGDGKKKDEDLDPRLVRAALGIALEDSAPKAAPAPVAKAPAPGATVAAKRPQKASSVTQELDALDLEPVREGAAAPKKGASIPAPKAALPKGALPARSVPPPGARTSAPPAARISAPPAAPAPKAPAPAASAPVRKRPLREPEPVPLPTDIKPIPRPRVTTKDSGEMKGPVLFDASRPSPAPAPAPVAQLPAAQVAQPRPMPTPLPPGPSAPVAQPVRRADDTPPRGQPAVRAPAWAGWVIVIGAIAIGVAIVAGGFWYRGRLQREAEQQQYIEQRLRELQQQQQQ